MKNIHRVALSGLCLMLFSILAKPGVAQDFGPGLGGIIITDNTADDPATFNPLISGDATSSSVHGWLYPAIIGVSPQTGLEEPNLPQALATGWEYDQTGTVLTITLRQDAFWNDGTQITSADYLWAVDAIRSGVTSSPRTSMFATLADGTPAGGNIVDVEAPDAFTVVVTFAETDCISFSDVNNATVVPAHKFGELYGTDYALMDEDPRRIPEVSFGPFKDIEFAPAQRVSLIADQSFPDTQLGFVSPEEWVLLSVPDTNVAVERFKAGDLTILAVPGSRQNEFRDNSDFQTYEFSANSFVFFAMNHADPSDPQPGLDEEGNLIPQTPHPILGDVLVRRAISHAVDVGAIIEGIKDNNAVSVATHTIPTSWVYNPELQYEFNPELAADLLTEAGWVNHDDDPGTPRICQNCLYARGVDAAFEGSPLAIRLRVPEGGVDGPKIGEFFKASLDEVGFDSDFAAIDWATAFLPELTGQTFDMALLSWSLGLPIDPDVTSFYTPAVDVPGSGFNFGSFFSAELNEILEEARTVPGCDQATRTELYLRAQEKLFEEMPYMYLYVSKAMTAVQDNVLNWEPTDFSRLWNTDAWHVLDTPD